MKKILICGASKNLGKFLLESFNKNHVTFGLSRNSILKKNHFKVDLKDYHRTEDFFLNIKKKINNLDAMIFCVGNSKKNYKKTIQVKEFQESLEDNFFCFVNLLNAYLKIFNYKPIKIIVISSIAGLKNINAPLTYSASKNILNFYCSHMAKELAKFYIQLNIISPGNILMKNNNWDKKIKKNKLKISKYIKKNVPSNKFCKPDEIYKLCKYLLENETNFYGSNIILDGGQVL